VASELWSWWVVPIVWESACPCCYSVDRRRRFVRFVVVRTSRVAVRLQQALHFGNGVEAKLS
jgi:hypothetical protein